MNEPEQAFPYKPPSDYIKNKYNHLFKLDSEIPLNILKLIFDKSISLVLIILLGFPILIFLKILYIIEGILIPANAGPLIYYYYAVSQGKVFKKYKIRVIKLGCIDHAKAEEGKWEAYSSEWKTECRTIMGKFVKNFILMRYRNYTVFSKAICLLLDLDHYLNFTITGICHKEI